MPARTPEDVLVQFGKAFEARDLDALLALYEPTATFVPQPGQTVSGRPAIREAMGAFLAIKGTLRQKPGRSIIAGDIALTVNEWSLSGTAPDGSAINMSGKAADVMRRQPDGTWLVAIDN